MSKLSISPEKIAGFCNKLNEKYPLIDSLNGWSYNADGNRFVNDAMITQLLNRLVLICTENNEAKDFFCKPGITGTGSAFNANQSKHLLLDNHRKHSH
jgi:hypothetical protein